jgi:cystathionine gamma-lyase
MKDPLYSHEFGTKCIHAGQHPETITGAVMTPIFQTSTFAQKSPGVHKGYEYSRTQNPTRKVLEDNLASLEHAKFCCCFASGCAATSIILLSLNPGCHVVAMNDLYGGTKRLFEKVFAKFGISFTFADLSNESVLDQVITESTKMIWIESPSNPLLKLVDIASIKKRVEAKNILVTVDNTFATPALQNPLILGADIVVHSTTKYIAGHSDVVGGAILTNNSALAEQFAFLSNAVGATPSPMDCFLVLRGIKTLHVRMDQHIKNATLLAARLFEHKNINQVYFPGLRSHPQYDLGQKQMKGPSGMISFILKGGLKHAIAACEKTRLFTCAESLGGVESLIEHPASMTHASLTSLERQRIGIEDGLVRISVGIEGSEDLWLDLVQAIE